MRHGDAESLSRRGLGGLTDMQSPSTFKSSASRKAISPVKVCVVGCGAHAKQALLPALSRLPQYSVECLIDLDAARCRTLADRYQVPHYSTSIEDIPPEVAAAFVVLPHHLHRTISCRLMQKGIHVFCEKPMATTVADADAMIRCALDNGVRLVIGNIYRFYWTSRLIKKIIERKELGDPVAFEIEEGKVFDWPTASGFYYDKKKAGGGVLMDIGAHILDLLLWWFQDYPQVLDYRDDDFGGVEAECYLELAFGPLVRGSIKLSRLAKLRNRYKLTFTGGVLSFQPYDPSGVCNTITVNRNGNKTLLTPDKTLTYQDYFKQQLEEFLEVIRSGVPPTVPAESVLPSIRLIEECYQDARRLELPWLVPNGSGPARGREAVEDNIQHMKILITGASGFIGSRIAERLYLDYSNIPRCLVRGVNNLARLSRFPAEIVRGDVLDYDSLVRAMDGCDAVIHCAYGNTLDQDTNAKINVLGTENLIRASLRSGVKKFIHLSSIEVYGRNQPSVVNEDTPPTRSTNSYGQSKLEAEKLCLRYFQERAFPVVILRLAAVHGPYSPIWTLAVVRRLLDRGFCLSSQFGGICNPLYIDDCVDAILLALERANAIGDTFVISGGEQLTWNEYFLKYNEVLGLPPLETASKRQLHLYRIVRKIFDLVYNYLQPKYGNDIFFTYSRLRESGRLPNIKAFLQKGSLLEALDVFNRPAFYSIEKAKRKLGFEPKHNFDRGMMLVKQWLHHTSQIREMSPGE